MKFQGIKEVYDFKNFNLNEKLNQEYLISICSNEEIYFLFNYSFFKTPFIDLNKKENPNSYNRKRGFRYKLIDFLFIPYDYFKSLF